MDRNHSDQRLTPEIAPWLADGGAQAVCRAIAAGGHGIFFVGGCVRNALLGAPVGDIDLATDAVPESVITLTEAAGLRAVPTGIDHGTITVVADGTGYEVTTFRRDVATDGRRATVAFSSDIAEDARRRDFTMNAIYADAEGRIIDPLHGLPDLRARRVRFIEDADRRIEEDYLRALRYFRFHAWYGDDASGLDPEALAAIGSHIDGLETLSGERIGTEMRKLLSAPDPSTALGAMQPVGVLQTLLPGADTKLVMLVIDGAQHLGLSPDWIGRLAALGGTDVASRLRLSRADARVLERIVGAFTDGMPVLETAFRHGSRVATQSYLLSCAVAEQAPCREVARQVQAASEAIFPLSAKDLMPDLQGPDLGAELARLTSEWIASGFSLTRQELLALSRK